MKKFKKNKKNFYRVEYCEDIEKIILKIFEGWGGEVGSLNSNFRI